MYTAFFGLRCLPFEDRADVRFFFPAAEHEEAIAAMQYEVQHGSGVGLILGEPGSGKTMVIRALLQRLTQNEKVVVVTVPGSGATDLLRETCKGFGVSLSSSVEDARGMARLRRHFSRSVRDGYRPVLIIDQAEHMSPADLVDVESLLDLQDERGRLVRIVLVAEPRFKSLLEQPVFTRLRQLAFTEHGLSPLSREETAQYIRHRLKVAGAPMEEIFSDEAMDEVYAQTSGVPRVINQLCNAAMLSAFGSGDGRIEARHVGATDTASAPEIVEAPPAASFGRLTAAVCSNSLEETNWDVSEDPSEREFETDATSKAAIQLETLIQRAQGVAENLQRRLPRTMDAMEATQQRVSQLLADARQQIHSLESRLAHETARADQAALRLERAEQVAARAEQLEARLSAFAEQLTDQMDQVQSRVAEMMKFASPLDDARNRLEGAIRQADSTRSKMDETVERGLARLTRQLEETKNAAETTAGEILESAGQRARQCAEQVKTESSTATEKAERAIKAAATDGARKIAQAVAAAQSQTESTLQSVSGQVAMCDQKISHLRDAAEAGERTVQAAIVKAVRQADELKQSGEQLRQSLQGAREAGDDLRTLQAESSKSAARFETDATEARQICEHMSAVTAAADQKIGQLASVQAALTHLHERVGKLLTQAHPSVERADQVIQRLSDALSQSEKVRIRMDDEATKVVSEVEEQLERMRSAGAMAEKETKLLGTASEGAGQVLRQLTATREQVISDQGSLRKLLSEASSWTGRMESFQSVVGMGDKTAEKLAEIVSTGSSLAAQIPQLLEETQNQHTELEAAIQSLESLFRSREQVERGIRQVVEDARSFTATFRTEIAAGDQKLLAYHTRANEIELQLERVGQQAEGAREVSAKLQCAVDEAHAQSENLERVCVAVRKVFAGLSQASLSARKNAQEVEEFLATANETATSLKTWLTRVRAQIEGAITGGLTAEFSPMGQRTTSHLGTVAQAAELSLEGEPGAEKAHLVAGGLERKNAPAREISELIEKARQAKDPNFDADLLVGDAHGPSRRVPGSEIDYVGNCG